MKARKRNPRVYLEDILSAITRIEQYTVKGKKHFLTNVLVQDAVIRQLSIIGEAANKVPANVKRKETTIPWKKIVGMRNIIIHDYAETDIPTVWDTVKKDLGVLKKAVAALLQELP